jgi:hypothetical protein
MNLIDRWAVALIFEYEEPDLLPTGGSWDYTETGPLIGRLMERFKVSLMAPRLDAPHSLKKLWVAKVEVIPGQSVKASDNDLKTAIVKVLVLAHRGVEL